MAEAASMPDFTVKEVRMPELHLPEIKRDEIVRALSGIHVPDVDLSTLERPRVRGLRVQAFPWRTARALSQVDAGKLVAALAAARLARPSTRRSRWSPFRGPRRSPIVRSRDSLVAVIRPAPRRSRRRIAIVVLGLAAAAVWMLFRNSAFQARLGQVAQRGRQRIDAMRSRPAAHMDLETGEPVSVTAVDIAPMAAEAGTETVSTPATADVTEGAGNPA
jgi:hypothetical protein